ncbi:MAG: HD domain-containing protein [Clostridiales bacterium]|jgi:3'-5' exoribonuclease|nr:HD domain-containing protein [Clostridiales bacterium]
MKYIEDFTDGQQVIGHYLCRQKNTLETKSGKRYLSLVLTDKTGRINGKVWELNNDIQSFEEGNFIKIDAKAQLYQSEMQLKILRIRKSLEGEYDPADYNPVTDKDVETLFLQLAGFIKTVGNVHLRKLLESIFGAGEVASAFKKSSAAKTLHHSYMGGLAEHTVSVVQFCDFVSGQYKHINRDLLITAAMLHDVGKIYELSPFPENEYTDEGQLLGHIIIGAELVEKEASKISGFPPKLKLMLKHCILAHHGEYLFGSPKLPQIIEAYVLFYCDNADAKIKAFEEALSANKDNLKWLGYNRMLERNIRKTDTQEV